MITTTFSRRRFIEGATAAAVIHPLAGRAQDAAANKPRIKIGLIGAGGRGAWIAGLFKHHGEYEFHAVADYFQAAKAAWMRWPRMPGRRSAWTRLGVFPACPDSDLYQEGVVRNIASFHRNVTGGVFTNDTVRRSVDGCLASNLSAARRPPVASR